MNNTASSPHHHIQRNTGAVMRWVIYACIPGVIAQTFYFGFGTLIQIILAILVAVIAEAAVLELRKKKYRAHLKRL